MMARLAHGHARVEPGLRLLRGALGHGLRGHALLAEAGEDLGDVRARDGGGEHVAGAGRTFEAPGAEARGPPAGLQRPHGAAPYL